MSRAQRMELMTLAMLLATVVASYYTVKAGQSTVNANAIRGPR